MSKIKTVLQFEKQKPVSPWRTDIENAPRDGRNILIVCENGCYFNISYSYNDNPEFPWHIYESDTFVTHWMEIPKLPKS